MRLIGKCAFFDTPVANMKKLRGKHGLIRLYGEKPYRAAVLHGGPGALGSVACIARELSAHFGVLEPLQSEYTITGLIEELQQQLTDLSEQPLTLIGHSWGAWLAILYAVRYPEMAKSLVLVGCAPFDADDVPQILQRRLKNLTAEEGKRFRELLCLLEQEQDQQKNLARLGKLAVKADNYAPIEPEGYQKDLFPEDGKMYTAIWGEAAALRENGTLQEQLRSIRCPILVIQGEQDPHPMEGVTKPFDRRGVSYQKKLLPQCGHSPFLERFAKDEFYATVIAWVQGQKI